MYDRSKVQWTMTVTIFHGPTYGHAVELATETTGHLDWQTHDTLGTWRGVGVPSESLQEMRTLIDTVFFEHMVRRYGVAETIEGWGDVPDPF